jgi:hypothetical protein
MRLRFRQQPHIFGLMNSFSRPIVRISKSFLREADADCRRAMPASTRLPMRQIALREHQFRKFAE